MIRSKSFSTLSELKKDQAKAETNKHQTGTFESILVPSHLTPQYHLAQYTIQIFDKKSNEYKLPIPLQDFYTDKALFTNSINHIVLSCPFANVLPFFSIKGKSCINISLTNRLTSIETELSTDLLLDGNDQTINQYDLHLRVPDLEPGDYNLSFKPTDDNDNLTEVILTIRITVNDLVIKPTFTMRSETIETLKKASSLADDLYESMAPKCPICYESLLSKDKTIVSLQDVECCSAFIHKPNKCGHVFHLECLELWKKTSCPFNSFVKCPQCRSFAVPLSINI